MEKPKRMQFYGTFRRAMRKRQAEMFLQGFNTPGEVEQE